MTVYLIRHPGDQAVKIGYTDGDPLDRLRAMQTGSASELTLVATLPDAPRSVEQEMHRRFRELRVRPNGEWFFDSPAIREAFETHAARHHREHLLEAVTEARALLNELIESDRSLSMGRLEQDVLAVHDVLDPTRCGCGVKTPAGVGPTTSTFWNDVRLRLAWDLVPFSFLYDLYVAWIAPDRPVSRVRFNADVVAIVQHDSIWSCDDKTRKHRPGQRMSRPEPLIAEYKLVDWYSPHYQGLDRDRLCRPELNDSYRGILRRPQASVVGAAA